MQIFEQENKKTELRRAYVTKHWGFPSAEGKNTTFVRQTFLVLETAKAKRLVESYCLQDSQSGM